MKRFCVFALLLALGLIPAGSLHSQQSQTAQQQAQTAQQQSQTAQQQSQTAQQQAQTAQQQAQTAQQQAQTAQQQAQTAQQQAQTAQQQGQTAQQAQTAQQQAQAAEDQAYMAEVKDKQTDRLYSSRDVLKSALGQKVGVTKDLVEKAKCVIIIPSVKRAGFIFGIDYGRGTMSCRLGENFNGPWSAPAMYVLEGGNFGLQIGVQVTDLVLLVMNERGVNSLLGSKSKLGVDASYAVGPFGRSVMGATDMGMKADILAFSRTGGAYLGAVLNGSSLRPDGTGNQALYGRELTAKQIVRSGEVLVPPAGRPLIQMLEETKVAAAAPAGGNDK
jgi:lipid-binding SYLF domain-containing protein